MLFCFLHGMLPVLASDDPALVKGGYPAWRFIETANVDFDLPFVAAEEARPANRTETSPAKRRYLPRAFKLLGSPVRIGQKCRTGYLAAIGTMTETTLIRLAVYGIANATA